MRKIFAYARKNRCCGLRGGTMLSQFSFSNYKSFKEEAFLDFTAEPIKDNKKSVIVDQADGEEFLPVLVIYGPNGGGKSTVLEALGYLRMRVLRPYVISQIEDNAKYEALLQKSSGMEFKEKYHKFCSVCSEQPISFDIMLRTDGSQYRYQLSCIHNEIVEENLYQLVIGKEDASVIFERSLAGCVLGEELEGVPVEKLKNSMPLIAHTAINYNVKPVDEVISWFLNVNFLDYDNPSKEQQIILPKTEPERIEMFEMLQKMDIHISDFRIEKDKDGNIENIYTKHLMEDGGVVEIPFEEESSGTRKLFSCLCEIINCLKSGTLLIADELDAKLHPKLLRYIIELFTDPGKNRHGAQLLLTSHDITTMTAEVYRRDEIWFCALNARNASKLYSLISFKKENGQTPRGDEAYGKQYLEGRYGADPYIRKILDWGIYG